MEARCFNRRDGKAYRLKVSGFLTLSPYSSRLIKYVMVCVRCYRISERGSTTKGPSMCRTLR
ncbi:hypothetical protein M6B38_113590 [Iris pallida]|uniref:Uncharacterized protein n=1 Tax=Iris pallida TaxID=29817 RepID=A0AAX6IKT1_IRIPA|nr:hypothetical protein M6B38_113590 [Iris pallida]